MTVYPQAQLGEDGFPVANADRPPSIALAKRTDGSESAFQWAQLGCDADVRVVAWIDVDDSEGFQDSLGSGRVLTDAEPSTDLHEELAAARPRTGDWVAISPCVRFHRRHRSVRGRSRSHQPRSRAGTLMKRDGRYRTRSR